MPVAIAELAPKVATQLAVLTDALQKACGDEIVSLIIYGGLARGRFRPGLSDVNLMVVLNHASARTLAAAAPALNAAGKSIDLQPFIVEKREIAQLFEVFPTKMLDIRQHYLVLHGEDPLRGFDATKQNSLVRLRQEMHNLLLRLRRRLIVAASEAAVTDQALLEIARPLAIELGNLLWLSDKPAAADDSTASIYQAAATAFQLDGESLARLAELRQDPSRSHDHRNLSAAILDVVARATDIADELAETQR